MKQRFILNSDRVHKNAVEAVSNIEPEPVMEVIIREYVQSKTASQRDLFHVLCREFGESQGLTEGQMKLIIKGHVFGLKEVSYSGVKMIMPDRHTESCNRKEYSQLIEQVHILASEVGVVLSQ